MPAAKYAQLSGEAAAAARDDCDYVVPPGWDHNCYVEGPDGPVLTAPVQEGTGQCVGACAYANIPKGGCGDDLTPYECEDLYGDGGETSGVDPTDGESGMLLDLPRELRWAQ